MNCISNNYNCLLVFHGNYLIILYIRFYSVKKLYYIFCLHYKHLTLKIQYDSRNVDSLHFGQCLKRCNRIICCVIARVRRLRAMCAYNCVEMYIYPGGPYIWSAYRVSIFARTLHTNIYTHAGSRSANIIKCMGTSECARGKTNNKCETIRMKPQSGCYVGCAWVLSLFGIYPYRRPAVYRFNVGPLASICEGSFYPHHVPGGKWVGALAAEL